MIFGHKKYFLKLAMDFHDYLSVPFFCCYVYGYGLVMRYVFVGNCSKDDYMTGMALNMIFGTYTAVFVIGGFAFCKNT